MHLQAIVPYLPQRLLSHQSCPASHFSRLCATISSIFLDVDIHSDCLRSSPWTPNSVSSARWGLWALLGLCLGSAFPHHSPEPLQIGAGPPRLCLFPQGSLCHIVWTPLFTISCPAFSLCVSPVPHLSRVTSFIPPSVPSSLLLHQREVKEKDTQFVSFQFDWLLEFSGFLWIATVNSVSFRSWLCHTLLFVCCLCCVCVCVFANFTFCSSRMWEGNSVNTSFHPPV